MIDFKEMPIDEYNRQLLSESKSTRWVTQPGWFANMLCYDHVAVYFLQSALLFLKRFIIFQSALLSFKALFYLSKRFYFLSKRFYYFSKRFYTIFLSASKHLFFILNASQRLFFILLNMRQCPILFSKALFSSCFNF